jgi:hypothetical protein
MNPTLKVNNIPIKDAFKVAEAKTFYDNYLKVKQFLGTEFANTQYLYDDFQRKRLVDAKAILHISNEIVERKT